MSEQRKVRTDFNPHTGSTIVTKFNGSEDFATRWDNIFKKKEEKEIAVDSETPITQEE